MEGKTNPKLWATVTISVAIIGFLGLVISAFLETLPELLQPSQAVTVEITSVASSIAMTQTEVITNTPTETQENQIVTPTGIPTSTENPEIFSPNKSTFAALVGVTDSTAFSTTDAMNYSYMANVDSLEKAISELERVFNQNDIVYVVHVPNLRITPGNPGSCKLFLEQISQLNEYPLGWIVGGENIIPDHFKAGLEFCFGQ